MNEVKSEKGGELKCPECGDVEDIDVSSTVFLDTCTCGKCGCKWELWEYYHRGVCLKDLGR